MYHPLAVDVYQPTCDIFELRESSSYQEREKLTVTKQKSHKFKSVRVPMHLDELVDIPTLHPL